jgi:hypothetical protein
LCRIQELGDLAAGAQKKSAPGRSPIPKWARSNLQSATLRAIIEEEAKLGWLLIAWRFAVGSLP